MRIVAVGAVSGSGGEGSWLVGLHPARVPEGHPVSAADVRESWLRFQDDVSARAVENKQSSEVLLALGARYRSLSGDERGVIAQLLAEQLGSDAETDRFDALALIAEFKVRPALPALRRLADWLEEQTTPGAP